MITIDRYTKAVLTIIAASLIWLCLASGVATTPIEAQSNAPQRVIVSGWADENGYVHSFPPQKVGGSSTAAAALPVRDDRR